MFLREACTLPDGFVLRQERFSPDWMLVADLTAVALDAKIRSAGWHFMWMMGSHCRCGFGWTEEGAVRQALERALNKMATQFNASELDSLVIRKYLGFSIAKAVLLPRLIQHLTSLDTPNAQAERA
jgi:hypothetical protein